MEKQYRVAYLVVFSVVIGIAVKIFTSVFADEDPDALTKYPWEMESVEESVQKEKDESKGEAFHLTSKEKERKEGNQQVATDQQQKGSQQKQSETNQTQPNRSNNQAQTSPNQSSTSNTTTPSSTSKQIAKPKPTISPTFPGREYFKEGKKNEYVTQLGHLLVNAGYGKYYQVGPGPEFTSADRKNCQAFQKSQGWTGADADGYPGPETWKRLVAIWNQKK